MPENNVQAESPSLLDGVRDVLTNLAQRPYPHVPNPESAKKRASVALVLRVRPGFEHWPAHEVAKAQGVNGTPRESLDAFFAQDWVQHGDPEVVFIKRAARVGDMWTSHVALPGGKRDPEDEDDKAVAVRETAEEIGLDLKSPHAIYVGNLPERIVSTSWGKVPIMVLCPFVFLWTEPDLPPLKLQPGEVASTHWVPLRVLLSASSRTYEYVDVSNRFARRGGYIVKTILSSILGKMRFSAIKLVPSESLYCTSTTEFFDPREATSEAAISTSWGNKFYEWYRGDHASSADRTRPLLLWGLTLGMLADFLDQLPPYNAVQLWKYPTFTSRDVRWTIDIMTASLKRRNKEKLRGTGLENQTAVDAETAAVSTGDNPWFIGRLSDRMIPLNRGSNQTNAYAVGVMLEGYYDTARRGIWLAAILRVTLTLAVGYQVIRRCSQFFRRS